MSEFEPSPGYRVREASLGDIAVLADLVRRQIELQRILGGYTLSDAGFDWAAWVRAKMSQPGHWFLVAERNEALLGYVYGRLRSQAPESRVKPGRFARLKPRSLVRRLLGKSKTAPAALPVDFSGWGIIEDCFVIESARRQGVCGVLVTALMERFRRRAVRRVEISMLANNDPSIAVSKSLGFEVFRLHMLSPPLESTEGDDS
jgi:hypothetical protein